MLQNTLAKATFTPDQSVPRQAQEFGRLGQSEIEPRPKFIDTKVNLG